MNINDIAKLAGVSRATVSRYLNDGYVSSEKRDLIRAVIEETGYTPSRQAQILRTKQTKIIGVIIPKINSDSISRMIEGISKVLGQAGFQLLLANTHNDEKEELRYLQTLVDYQVDGIILLGTILTKAHKAAFKELEIPIIILAQQLPGYGCVYNDDYQAAFDLTECLLKKGKHPGYIGVTEKDEASGKSRREGFEAACKKYGVECPKEAMIEAGFSSESGYQKAAELLERGIAIDGLFCATDHIAYGAAQLLKEAGKKIPEDVQVVGVGDSQVGRLMDPRLTTIRFHYYTSGMEAAKMLLQILQGEAATVKEIKMGHCLEVRESTLL